MSESHRRAQSMRRIADASSVGLAFPIAIALGFFWGKALDSYLGTGPWCMVIFTAFGVGGGFLNAIRVAIRVGKEEDQAEGGR